jgi:hemerythrin
MKWDKRLETGIIQIDDQHREIFKRIDQLGLAILNGEEKVRLVHILEFLDRYVVEHFGAEEDVLNKIRYPELPGHTAEHQKFRRMCKDLISECSIKGTDQYLALETDKILRTWWEDHILKSDMSFILFMKKEGWKFPGIPGT